MSAPLFFFLSIESFLSVMITYLSVGNILINNNPFMSVAAQNAFSSAVHPLR